MTSTIAELNDAMRRGGPAVGRWMMTQGVMAEGLAFMLLAAQAVQQHEYFSPDDDPYGEHDFGAFTLCGQRLFWKIDYYDHTMRQGSPDPSDPILTVRVLTIMLASEY